TSMIIDIVKATADQPAVIAMGNETLGLAVDDHRVGVILVELGIQLVDLLYGLLGILCQRSSHSLHHVARIVRAGAGKVITDSENMFMKILVEGLLALHPALAPVHTAILADLDAAGHRL